MENGEQLESDFSFFYEAIDWFERHLEEVGIAILAVAFVMAMVFIQ